MRIVAFGSSHTTGYNLDDIAGLEYNTVSKFAYPQVTADALNCECLNLGRTGNGIDQIYTDVFGYLPDSQPDDIIIIHLPINTAWFKLITSDDNVVNIVKPDSLSYKGKRFKNALYDLYGTLTGDNHWIRLWYINFYSLITLLKNNNKKFIWFFDCKDKLYFDFEEQMTNMPKDCQIEIQNLKRASADPSPNYIGLEFGDHLYWHLPHSLKECGHYTEQAHKFWAVNILVPYIKEHLT
jgi:uncharacterized protein YdcH (DUF465 family)